MLKLLTNNYLPALYLALTLVGALVLQHIFGWVPCPLCVLQRLTAIGLLVSLLFLARASGRGADAALVFATLFTGAGLATGGVQLHMVLQPSAESCSPGLGQALANFVEALPGTAWLLEGAGSCGDTAYSFFGIPLAAWSMLAHGTALGLAYWQLEKRN